MWYALGVVVVLATVAPGVVCAVSLMTGHSRPDAGCVVAMLWLAVVVVQVGRGVRPGIRDEQREQRRRTGRCLACGYDLQATPGRCPECGLGRQAP